MIVETWALDIGSIVIRGELGKIQLYCIIILDI